MPRVDAEARMVRDRLIFDLWLAGYSLRAIGQHRGVHLSVARVHKVLAAECLMMGVEEWLREEYDAALARARGGDEEARQRCRRLLSRLEGLGPSSHAG